MPARATVHALIVMLCLCAGTSRAQVSSMRRYPKGESTGVLVLDTSARQLSHVFHASDSSLSGAAHSDGRMVDSIEYATLSRDTAHLAVNQFDSTEVVAGARMSVSLIVFNGSIKRVTYTKRPEPPVPATGAAPPEIPMRTTIDTNDE